MIGSYIRFKIDKETWTDVKRLNRRIDRKEKIIKEVFKTYLKSKKVKKENKELKRIVDKNSDTIQRLRRTLERVQDKNIKFNKEISSMGAKNRKIKLDYEELRDNPIIEEKIIYQEDKTTINALRTKQDKLIKDLWKARNDSDQMYKEKEGIEHKMQELEQRVSDWKNKFFAILIIGKPYVEKTELEELEIEIINSKDYYEYKAHPANFLRRFDNRRSFVIELFKY